MHRIPARREMPKTEPHHYDRRHQREMNRDRGFGEKRIFEMSHALKKRSSVVVKPGEILQKVAEYAGEIIVRQGMPIRKFRVRIGHTGGVTEYRDFTIQRGKVSEVPHSIRIYPKQVPAAQKKRK